MDSTNSTLDGAVPLNTSTAASQRQQQAGIIINNIGSAVMTSSAGHHVKGNQLKITMTRSAVSSLSKADSVNSSEDTPSEELQYSDKMSDSLPSP